ncbi:MAG: HD domain-containing protein [Bacilli bacterium]|nr:HD domain-containing protein [Bacilli bacterium]
MQINIKLKKYIEEFVFPEYNKNESGHGINHIKDVIKRSFELVEENHLDVNMDMVYVIAAYHDIGHYIDSKTHEIISAEIMFKDKNLSNFFNEKQLKIIKEAIEDHRASSKNVPRSIYGKIVSSADRSNKVEECLSRTYTYGKKLNPTASDEELFLNAYNALLNKFGKDGYAKFYFKDSKYELFLKEIRELLKDKDKYINTQREFIKQLKKKNELIKKDS